MVPVTQCWVIGHDVQPNCLLLSLSTTPFLTLNKKIKKNPVLSKPNLQKQFIVRNTNLQAKDIYNLKT